MALQWMLLAAGELVKFRLAPSGTVFSALKAMLDDFSGHNVEAVAELLDTAGRFLYHLPESHSRMASMAEVRTHMPHSARLLAYRSQHCTHGSKTQRGSFLEQNKASHESETIKGCTESSTALRGQCQTACAASM